ncbi:MAG TPA: GFA family protein [Burkholderiaceae bacterium]|nr:GFA family protein [Burkholderiaceae bacterium]
MKLNGSCHCGSVSFTLESPHPYPFMRCYCSICRKTAGSGGYAINLGGESKGMKVKGRKNIAIYRAKMKDTKTGKTKKSEARRHFCKKCGSPLWVWDPRWPKLVHPHASAIDTPLPAPPERTHLMLGSKPKWVAVSAGARDKKFDVYPDESIADWHRRLRVEGK